MGAYSFFGGVHGLIWQGNESCFDIVDPSGTAFTEAWGVSGVTVVGFYSNSVNFEGFRYNSKTEKYTNVACAGWSNTRAYGVDGSMIVGDVANSTSGPFSAMLYDAGKCTIFNYPKAV